MALVARLSHHSCVLEFAEIRDRVSAMPKFTLKVMLIFTAVVALWLSTVADYPGGYDVRYSIVLLTVVASVLRAYCSSGRQKCFWLAFSAVLLAAVWSQGMLVPRMDWVSYLIRTSEAETASPYVANPFGNSVQVAPSDLRGVEALAETLKFMVDLILATTAGFIGLYVYDHSRIANQSS